ncbi:MAG: ketol-acid reductoisomerase, partial [candidate division Zixibacteria bacterium]|nr:ketol-acid reductoisomerase [candidate division Zixibacteria bacterium]
MKIYRDREADLSFLRNKTIGILGYGSQGRAQAQNLADPGLKVIIGLPLKSKSRKVAARDGFRVFLTEEIPLKADIISFLAPDHLHQQIFQNSIAKNLKTGQALIFAAGFSIHFKLIKPPKYVDVMLVAPAGPGKLMRELFLLNQGIPAFLAVEQNYSGKAQEIGLA